MSRRPSIPLSSVTALSRSAWWTLLLRAGLAAVLVAGLVGALITGDWNLKQIYRYAYLPLAGTIWLLGAFGQLPRVKRSTAGEGHER